MCVFNSLAREKHTWEILFPAIPDLADMLGRPDLDFDICLFLNSKFPDVQVPRFPKSVPGWAHRRLLCRMILQKLWIADLLHVSPL